MVGLNVHFVSTLPRSGSTLMINFLGQNPAVHITPTNDLIEHIVQVRNTWTGNISFKSQGIEIVKPRILGMLRGMFSGFFEDELAAGRIVLDKSRGWLAYIELLEEILCRRVKIITTIRPVEDIAASFEKLYRRSMLTKPLPPKEFFFRSQTVSGRADELLSPGGVAGIAINRFRDVIDRGLANRLIIVPYRQLTTKPKEVVKAVSSFLGLPAFEHNPDNIRQLTQEDDTVHGMDLHQIRCKIEPEIAPAWLGILPPKLAHFIADNYADINSMANGPVLTF